MKDKFKKLAVFITAIILLSWFYIITAMPEVLDYQRNGVTRIVEYEHRAGHKTYDAEYEIENIIGTKIYRTITFERFEEPCSNGYHMLGLIQLYGQPPEDASLECAKKRIDKYLADIENRKGWKVVNTKYIKYP